MNRRDAHDVLAALTEVSEKGVKVEPFAISLNLPGPRIDAIIESLSLQRVGSHQGEWAFAKNRWQQLLNKIELALGEFHESRPELPGAGLRDIQLALNPFIETPILEAAMASLIDKKRLDRRAARFHLPAHQVRVSQQDRQLWARATPMLAPQSGSPMSLHQVAEALGVDKRTLEISMKNAVKIGEMALLAKNRYVPVWYLAQLAGAAEVLARESADGNFTVAGYCEQTKTGRNFAIGLLEYFDRVGFTERSGNHRRIKQPAATVFASADEAARGRGSHPGGAPGLQIR